MSRRLLAAIALGLVIAGFAWTQYGSNAGAQMSSGAAGGRGGASGPAAASGGAGAGGAAQGVPVVTAVAKRADVPVYMTGIGTVKALNTVAITPQVSGAITQVAFTEGQMVKRGDLLVQIDPRPYQNALAQMQGQLAKDQAALADAELDLKRYRTLAAENSIALQQVDTQAALVLQDQGLVKTDQANVATAALNLSMTRIVTPINGRTGLRQIDIGNILQANTTNTIVVVTQLSPISAIFTLPEDAFEQVRAATAKGMVALTAMDRNGTTTLDQGTLLTLSNEIDPATGTIALKATFPNGTLRLWPGEFISVRILLGMESDVVTVPSQAIQNGPEGQFVYVISENNIAEQRSVRSGTAANGQTVISEGLRPGERVVTEGQFRLINGSRVRISPVLVAGAVGAAGNR